MMDDDAIVELLELCTENSFEDIVEFCGRRGFPNLEGISGTMEWSDELNESEVTPVEAVIFDLFEMCAHGHELSDEDLTTTKQRIGSSASDFCSPTAAEYWNHPSAGVVS